MPVVASLLEAPGRRRSGIRLVLNPHHPAIEDAVGIAQGEMLRDLADTLRPPLALWAARERDLMAGHARQSCAPVRQPVAGLTVRSAQRATGGITGCTA